MSSENVVIIIPTYNEAEGIEETIHQVFAHAASLSEYRIKVLIFDSASTDKTQEIVANLQAIYPDLVLQSEPQKTGLGSAYHQAMHYALYELAADIVFEFDADLSHQPVYIEPMLQALKHCDVAVGSRYIKGGAIPSDWGWHRKALSIFGNWVARLLLTPRYKDLTSGFRATRRVLLQKALPNHFISNDYAYKLELFWRLHQYRARIVEVPIHFVDRKQGHSKLPTNSILDSLRVLFTIRYRQLISYFKMCAVGFVGLFVQVVSYNFLRSFFSPFYASQIAVALAILNNYLLNSHFTFKYPSSWTVFHKIKALGLFAGYSLLMIFFQSYWQLFATKFVGTGLFKENTALIIGIIWGSFLNYFVYSRLVWQQHKITTDLK